MGEELSAYPDGQKRLDEFNELSKVPPKITPPNGEIDPLLLFATDVLTQGGTLCNMYDRLTACFRLNCDVLTIMLTMGTTDTFIDTLFTP